jgi:hypothetical protein
MMCRLLAVNTASSQVAGVLAGTAGDLQHLTAVREDFSQDSQYRRLVVLAGL